MNTLALWIGYAVIVAGGIALAAYSVFALLYTAGRYMWGTKMLQQAMYTHSRGYHRKKKQEAGK